MKRLAFLCSVALLAACGEIPDGPAGPTEPPPVSLDVVGDAFLSTTIPGGVLEGPEYTVAEGALAALNAVAGPLVVRVYQDEQPWGSANRAHTTLVAAPPAGLGKILGLDYFVHPLSDLAAGIPPGTALVVITSNSWGSPAEAAVQNAPAAQAALAAYLAEGGKLIVDMGDNLPGGGFIAPGSVGTPHHVFPAPCADATLVAPAGHPLVLGPDGVAGGGDDLDNTNVDLEAGYCYVAHGNLAQGITLPADATPLLTATFGGVSRPIMAEYCLGPGFVLLDTNTKEFPGQRPVGLGPATVMRNMFSYALSDASTCIIPVEIDIKPQSCPNAFNLKSKGVTPMAILGTGDFDASQVDPATVALAGVSPLRWDLKDVSTPAGMGETCTEEEGDGFMDLVLHFDTPELVAALGDASAGDVLTLPVTGQLKEEFGATPIAGEDDLLVVNQEMDPLAEVLVLTLSDDDYELVPLGFDFEFQGATWDHVYVNSNGSLTFGAGSSSYYESPYSFRTGPPRIAAFWDDLNPYKGGTVSVLRTFNQGGQLRSVTVQFDGVPEYYNSGSNTFSVTLQTGGRFEISYGELSATDALVGVTPGGGVLDPGEVDLSMYRGGVPSLGTTYEHFWGSDYGDPFDLTGITLKFRPL